MFPDKCTATVNAQSNRMTRTTTTTLIVYAGILLLISVFGYLAVPSNFDLGSVRVIVEGSPPDDAPLITWLSNQNGIRDESIVIQRISGNELLAGWSRQLNGLDWPPHPTITDEINSLGYEFVSSTRVAPSEQLKSKIHRQIEAFYERND